MAKASCSRPPSLWPAACTTTKWERREARDGTAYLKRGKAPGGVCGMNIDNSPSAHLAAVRHRFMTKPVEANP